MSTVNLYDVDVVAIGIPEPVHSLGFSSTTPGSLEIIITCDDVDAIVDAYMLALRTGKEPMLQVEISIAAAIAAWIEDNEDGRDGSVHPEEAKPLLDALESGIAAIRARVARFSETQP